MHCTVRMAVFCPVLQFALFVLTSAAIETARAAEVEATALDRPNVVIVVTDDQGYGDISALCSPILKTPNLDRLHDKSVRLTDFHSAPVCTPTRGQLLTGCDAMHNGAWSWAYGHEMIRTEVPTLAQLFRAHGYRTGHWREGGNLQRLLYLASLRKERGSQYNWL